jgi:hypothetical protein
LKNTVTDAVAAIKSADRGWVGLGRSHSTYMWHRLGTSRFVGEDCLIRLDCVCNRSASKGCRDMASLQAFSAGRAVNLRESARGYCGVGRFDESVSSQTAATQSQRPMVGNGKWGRRMAKRAAKLRPWTKDDVRMLFRLRNNCLHRNNSNGLREQARPRSVTRTDRKKIPSSIQPAVASRLMLSAECLCDICDGTPPVLRENDLDWPS